MSELMAAIQKRKGSKASMTRFINAFNTHDRETSIRPLVLRCEKFRELYNQFDEIQSQIEALVEGNAEQEETEGLGRENFETNYFNTLAKVEEYIFKYDQGNQNAENRENVITDDASPVPLLNVKLPTISFPHFDGSHGKWLKFRDTFNSLIHEHTSLSKIQKFHYLESALTGDAARVIRSLGISEANYDIAWKSLKDRYKDPRALIGHHLKQLFAVPVVKRESYAELRQLLDDFHHNLLALKSLGKPTDSWDSIMVYLLVTKLDMTTRREWERKSSSLREEPSLKDFPRRALQISTTD